MEPITTARLIIRRPAPSDLEDFLAYQTHPANLEHQSVEPKTEAEAIAYLEKQSNLEIGDGEGWMGLAVELQRERRLIGEVGAYLKPTPKSRLDTNNPQRQGDIGWSIHPDYQRQGYATEAAEALLYYLFHDWNLHRVTYTCDAPNIASFRVMERLGMRREAHFREDHFANGVWTDVYSYALLRKEWLERREKD